MKPLASISPSNHIPLPGTPLFQLLTQGMGSRIRVHTVGGDIEGELSGVTTGVITVLADDGAQLHIVFSTVVSFSFH